MTYIARFDSTSAANAYALVVAGPAAFYRITASGCVLPSSTLAVDGWGTIVSIDGGYDDFSNLLNGSDWQFVSAAAGAYAGTVIPNTEFTVVCELTNVTGTTWDIVWKLDGTTLFTNTGVTLPVDATGLLSLYIGAIPGNNVSGNVRYVGSVQIDAGASSGSAVQVFFDDFSSGDFSAWNATSGDAAVVLVTPGVPTFTILNLDHDGSTISEVTPIGGSLKWTYRLAQAGGPGEAQWAVALSDPSMSAADQFAPYRTDWKLVMHFNAVDTDLIAGILTPINTGSESNGVFTEVRCSGKDWLHWLEQPWPFGYADVVADVQTNQLLDPANLFQQWEGDTQETIAGDILTALDSNVGAVTFTPSYEGTGWSLTLDKEVGFGDNTSLLDMLNSIAELGLIGTDTYGFDWWCDPDATVHLVAPRLTSATSPAITYILDNSSVVVPPLDWTNNGPLETDTVVFGQAPNNTNRIGFSSYGPSQDVYRQWTQFAQASLASEDTIQATAAAIGFQDRFPQKDLKITVRPDLLDPIDASGGFRNLSGQAIWVTYDIAPFHTIDAAFWIKQQDFYSNDGCNWLCDLTLQQVYAATDPVS